MQAKAVGNNYTKEVTIEFSQYLVMTMEEIFDNLQTSKDFAEVFKMLQDGEKTASDVEKKLEAVEKELDYLLLQLETNGNIDQVQIAGSLNINSIVRK